MKSTKKFLTKNGYCHVLKDKIVFTPRGFMGYLGDITIEGRMTRILLFFSFLVLLIFYFAYLNFLQNQVIWAVVFALIGGYLVFGIFKGLNTSVHPIIERKKIKEVKYIEAVQDISPPSFEVIFNDRKGRSKKRIINLPRTSKYQSEVLLAIQIMREEELID